MDRQPVKQKRVLVRSVSSLATFCVVALLYLVVARGDLVHPFQVAAILVWLTTLYAVLVSVMALIRYYSRQELLFLFVGVAFFGAALFNGYEATILSDIFLYRIPIPLATVSLSVWFVNGLYLVAVMLFSLFLGIQGQILKNRVVAIKPWLIYLSAGVTVVAIAVAMYVIPLPQPYVEFGIFSRPIEIIPSILLGIVIIGYLYRGRWRFNAFEHWLIISFILLFLAHAVYMPFSEQLNDSEYVAALTVRMFAYASMFVGLAISSYKLFKSGQKKQKLYQAINVDLERERSRAQHSLEILQTKDWELGKNVEELKVTKQAMLNVLEDFDIAKKRIEVEKAKDEAIISSVGEGLVLTDHQARITYLNRAAEQMLGATTKDMVGKVWPTDVGVLDDQGAPLKFEDSAVNQALTTNTPAIGKKGWLLASARGHSFSIALTAAPILVDKKTIGAVVVFRDTTIESEVDKAKTEFVSLASHQLRTPLSTVSWYAEMLLGGDAGKLSKEQADYIKEVYRANRRMVELVNALLNVSRLEMGTFAIEPQTVSLLNISEAVIKELEPMINQKKLSLTVDSERAPLTIEADRNLTLIIFQNLLSNAVKYTPPGGSVKLVIAQSQAREYFGGRKIMSNSVTIAVTDSGYGIPEAQQHQIFSKLFRADNVKMKDTTGTGLGLYISKSILESLGGAIWFTSKENKGSSFYATIPLSGMRARTGSKRLSTGPKK